MPEATRQGLPTFKALWKGLQSTVDFRGDAVTDSMIYLLMHKTKNEIWMHLGLIGRIWEG